MKYKTRMKISRIKDVLLWIWFIIWGLLHLLWALMMMGGGPAFSVFIIILVWWIPIILSLIIDGAIDKKRKKREEEERLKYRAEYVKPLLMKSEMFGELKFDHDTKTSELELTEIDLPPIGDSEIEQVMVYEYSGKGNVVIKALEMIYSRINEILDFIVEYVKETYDDEGITDENGEPITEEFIRGAVGISWIEIYIKNDIADITLMGGVSADFHEHIAEHGITVDIDGKTGNIN